MSGRLVLAVLAAVLCGVAAAHAQAEWRACAYLGATVWGLLVLVLFLGAGLITFATSKRSSAQ